MTLFNPDLEIVLNATLVAPSPAHGTATASLIMLGRQVEVYYTPQPGYLGPDRFGVTMQPNGRSVTYSVIVQAARPTRSH